MMRLRSHIAQAENGIRGKLPLNGKEIILAVRIRVGTWHGVHTRQRQEMSKIDVRIRMTGCGIQRRERQTERGDMRGPKGRPEKTTLENLHPRARGADGPNQRGADENQ